MFGLAALLAFSALARGAHDLWAATAVAVGLLLIFIVFLAWHRTVIWTGSFGPWLLIVGTLVFSFWEPGNKSDAAMALRDILMSLLLFFVAANIFQDDEDWSLLLIFMVPVLWIQMVLSVLQTPWGYISATTGTLINANLKAAFLLAWVPALMDRFLTAMGAESKIRWYWLSGLVATLLALFLTWSISAWVVLGGVVVVWSRQMGVRWKLLLGLVVGFALALLVIKAETSASVVNRLAWWKTAVNMFVAHPWSGVGLGNFPSAFLAYRVPAGENTLSAHSWFFQILAEMGMAGLVLMAMLITAVLKAANHFQERSNLEKSLVMGSAAVLLYCLMNIGTEYLILRILIPLFLVPLTTKNHRALHPRLSVVVISAGAVVFSFLFLIAPFLASRHYVTGRIHLAEANIEPAEKSFQIATELDPLHWEARRELARIWFQRSMFRQDQELFERAVAMQKQAIRLNRLNGRLWWELGTYLTSHGASSSEVETCFQKARDLGFISSLVS